jgi:hypothetical protein
VNLVNRYGFLQLLVALLDNAAGMPTDDDVTIDVNNGLYRG